MSTKLPDTWSSPGWQWVPNDAVAIPAKKKLKYWQASYTLLYNGKTVGYVVFDVAMNTTVFRKTILED